VHARISTTIDQLSASRSSIFPPKNNMTSRENCPFCNIAAHFPPSPSPDSNHELLSPSAFVVLSSPMVVAFLDIMPLSPGHLLVTTRRHHEKISDVTGEEARALGEWLPRLSKALASVTGVWDWNIVQNNGTCATKYPQNFGLAEIRANWLAYRCGRGASCTSCPFSYNPTTSTHT
jgi:diadenosine tetraphosphate (Ap4A) HIT family hydrolase